MHLTSAAVRHRRTRQARPAKQTRTFSPLCPPCPLWWRECGVEIPEALRVAAQDGVAFVSRELRNELDDNRHRCLVAGCERAHWPVGPNHQPIRPEALERDIKVRPNL